MFATRFWITLHTWNLEPYIGANHQSQITVSYIIQLVSYIILMNFKKSTKMGEKMIANNSIYN